MAVARAYAREFRVFIKSLGVMDFFRDKMPHVRLRAFVYVRAKIMLIHCSFVAQLKDKPINMQSNKRTNKQANKPMEWTLA